MWIAKWILAPRFQYVWVSAALAALTSCGFEESAEQARTSYVKNVESCVCRTLSFETDSYTGLEYAGMIDKCNLTVHGANPTRYEPSLRSEPAIESLRCPEDVEPWREVVRQGGVRWRDSD